MKKSIIHLFILFALVANLNAQKDDIKMYAFGHSLIDHRPPAIPTPSDETTVMHWMADIAAQADLSFEGGGQYGFLANHINLPPSSNWYYDHVEPVWDDYTESYSESGINTMMLTVANFIQYQLPTDPYPLDYSTTVMELTEGIFDWVNAHSEESNYYLYANWPEMDLENPFPGDLPSQEEIDSYHEWTAGSFTDWWKIYQDELMLSREDYKVRVIPTGMIISKILTELIPGQIPFDHLYEDSDPHGRANTYFLAGLISYMAIYEREIEDNYELDPILHEGITSNIDLIKDFIWAELNAFNFDDGTSRVFLGELPTSTSDKEKNNVVVGPNPNHGIIYLENIPKESEISIYDSKGESITFSRSGNQIVLDQGKINTQIIFLHTTNPRGVNNSVEKLILLKN